MIHDSENITQAWNITEPHHSHIGGKRADARTNTNGTLRTSFVARLAELVNREVAETDGLTETGTGNGRGTGTEAAGDSLLHLLISYTTSI